MSSRPAVVRYSPPALDVVFGLKRKRPKVNGVGDSDTPHKPQVIDNGTGYTKMGYAGNAEPSYIVPTCIAASDDKGSSTLSKKGKIGEAAFAVLATPSHTTSSVAISPGCRCEICPTSVRMLVIILPHFAMSGDI